MAQKKTKNDIDRMTFEKAIENLTAIVDKIETGKVPLQESLEQYEKGMALVQRCREILQDAEKRIEMITESKTATTDKNIKNFQKSDPDINDVSTKADDNTDDDTELF